jgi:TRAP-type C4-dicarboxylate transport system permease large subunit
MSLAEIVRAALPTLAILLLGLLIVTYWPALSLALPHLLFPS